LVLVVLLPALFVGLLISMFQAATQINEATLSFIPKLVVTLMTLLIAGPWIVRLLVNYTQNLIENIPYLIG
jgi:flagellar biosynthetic protein FliQ